MQGLKAEMENLMNTLNETEEYIKKVMNNEIKPTPEVCVGREREE